MLKNIRLHVEKDEEKQKALEQSLAQHIKATYQSNINKLQRTIPSLIPFTTSNKRQSISVFCNKYGEYNLVDYGTGRVVYGFHPYSEVLTQVNTFRRHSPFVQFNNKTTSVEAKKSRMKFQPELIEALPSLEKSTRYHNLPKNVECLVVLGCGLGIHIEELIKQANIKHLILYEAEAQYFASSILVTNWQNILKVAADKETSLYVQIGNDGRDIVSDITELRQHYDLTGFYLYKHFNHVTYDDVFEQLTNKDWSRLVNTGLSFKNKTKSAGYCNLWTQSNQLQRYSLPTKKQSGKFKKNIKAFQHFYPDIAKQFENYSPSAWLPIALPDGQINLLEKQKLASLYSDSPKKDSKKVIKDFEKYPNRDGLALGYTGEKLAHYAHYSFVKKMDTLLNRHQEKRESLPKEIQSIIVFGLGAGYPLETLCENHEIENLFLCEPNLDFFYGSLYAIDWHNILNKIDSAGARLYINVGDDGSNLFRDLLAQFYSIGPYILNNTYFLQSYYDEHLNQSVSQLREQLQVVISMGEYFDHAYYGINHTLEGIRRNYPTLRKSPSNHLEYENKDVPIFLIGSGPSIDGAIEAINDCQKQCIVVSCGTALKVLHKHGITPDFHAEIEQNRASFEWCSLIDDSDYLNSISLISCNGIHPDTCDLFKDVYVIFKDGESSTISTLNVFGEEKAEVIQFAFPTVANFATNLFSILGFRNIYLLGIDLGFIDKQNHHSKLTGYFEKGEEVGDYSTKYNTSVTVEGNFRPTVLTKPEFKLSKQIIEQTIKKASKDVLFFNCSDGAKITGTTPLAIDNILITTNKNLKNSAVLEIKQNAFQTVQNNAFFDLYDKRYSKLTLTSDLEKFLSELCKPITMNADVIKLIETFKTTLFDSYQKGDSLFFYYLYGTVNYANAAFSKLVDYKRPNKKVSKDLGKALNLWRDSFNGMSKLLTSEVNLFDSTTVLKYGIRERKTLSRNIENKTILVVSNSTAFIKSCQSLIEERFNTLGFATYISFNRLIDVQANDFDFILYDQHSTLSQSKAEQDKFSECRKLGTVNTLIASNLNTTSVAEFIQRNPKISILKIDEFKDEHQLGSLVYTKLNLANHSLIACLAGHVNQVILPKFYCSPTTDLSLTLSKNDNIFFSDQIVLDFYNYICIFSPNHCTRTYPLNVETRGKPLQETIKFKDRVLVEIEEMELVALLVSQQQDIPELFDDCLFQGFIFDKN